MYKLLTSCLFIISVVSKAQVSSPSDVVIRGPIKEIHDYFSLSDSILVVQTGRDSVNILVSKSAQKVIMAKKIHLIKYPLSIICMFTGELLLVKDNTSDTLLLDSGVHYANLDFKEFGDEILLSYFKFGVGIRKRVASSSNVTSWEDISNYRILGSNSKNLFVCSSYKQKKKWWKRPPKKVVYELTSIFPSIIEMPNCDFKFYNEQFLVNLRHDKSRNKYKLLTHYKGIEISINTLFNYRANCIALNDSSLAVFDNRNIAVFQSDKCIYSSALSHIVTPNEEALNSFLNINNLGIYKNLLVIQSSHREQIKKDRQNLLIQYDYLVLDMSQNKVLTASIVYVKDPE